jgi:protoporphyrinogen oxidase
MARLVVIGAGPMGLAAAYQATKGGHQVDVFEAGPVAGGMSAHFDFGGISLERFYHFVCRGDQPTFDLMKELGLEDKLRWVPTSMGLFLDGRLRPWGNPLALLRFPGISPLTKLRYGLFGYISMRRRVWPSLENRSAKEWIIKWCGRKGYDQLWRSLFDLKFYEYADDISAAWIWMRMRRTWRSRSSLLQEELGYIEGGSATLVDALVKALQDGGGRMHLNSPVLRISVEDGHAAGISTSAGFFAADHVISTIPMPYVAAMIADIPGEWKKPYSSIKTVGICCVILKLQRSVSPHFWINLSGAPHDLPGVIEFSNLRPVGPSIVYAPYYMPATNEKFSWPDARLIDDAFSCLQLLNPALTRADLLDAKVSRLRYAQAICPPGFAAELPPIQTPILGLQIADTSFYYPEDRSIAESVHLGRKMTRALDESSREFPGASEKQAAGKQ